jgi:cytochrome c551/c552
MVRRYADTACQSRKPSILGDHLNDVAARWKGNSGAGVVLVCKPIELSFNAKDDAAHLPIATNLAAAGKDSVVGRKAESITKGVRRGTPIPRGSN